MLSFLFGVEVEQISLVGNVAVVAFLAGAKPLLPLGRIL